MKLKTYLIIFSIFLLVINVPFIQKYIHTINYNPTTRLIIFTVISTLLLLLGQWFRMLRTKIIIDQVRVGGVRGQFASLAVGAFYNTLLPFRVGEILRSYLISSRLQISFLYTFVAVIIERAFDLLFVCIVALLISIVVNTNISTLIFISAMGGIIFSIFLLSLLTLLAKENRLLLKLIWTTTSLFNKKIQNSYRFKVWSLIYGLQKFIANRNALINYFTLAMLSWVCLLASTGLIAYYYFSNLSLSKLALLASEPYIAINAVFGSIRHELFKENTLNVLGLYFDGTKLADYISTTWFILIVPMLTIGFISIFIFDWKKKKQVKPKEDIVAYSNKLSRQFDLSQEFPAFLDSYFKGNSLTKILHKIELDGKVSLVKFFKGGSDAVTLLAIKDSNMYVKKIVSAEFTHRLKLQHDWLIKYKSKNIVKVVNQEKNKLYYSIDLEYSPKNIPFFEYMHSHSLLESKAMIDETWQIMFNKVYSKIQNEKKHEKNMIEYINDRLINKITSAAKINSDLSEILKHSKIMINGQKYDNFYTILDKIKNKKECWNDLITYRETSAIHGDLTIDNIMINIIDDSPYIIDPSDDNQVKGPVLDFGRHMQSLSYGYEFLCGDDSEVSFKYNNDLPTIKFHDERSAKYMQLEEYVKEKIIPKYLTTSEANSVEFHVALFYSRMLAHRVIINPNNVLKFYAVSIIAFNNYYNKYKK